MNNLYADLAMIYEAMYATFIDYELEYKLYHSFLQKYDKKSVLEIGCGTGNLSPYFGKDRYTYFGLDLSQEMLKIAQERNPDTAYMQGDMRSFYLPEPVESMIMTGRTISYLVSNEDVIATIKSVYDNLEKSGFFCFDFIDANKFIPEIGNGKIITHEADYNQVTYLRKSIWETTLQTSWCFNWESIFYTKQGNELIEIGKDTSIIRTFTVNEIELFLLVNGFEIKEIIERASYAFPTFVVVAEKK